MKSVITLSFTIADCCTALMHVGYLVLQLEDMQSNLAWLSGAGAKQYFLCGYWTLVCAEVSKIAGLILC
jgi:hypothetical protein